MNFNELLETLVKKGIRVGEKNGNVKVVDPNHEMNDELLIEIKRNKLSLLAWLRYRNALSVSDFPYSAISEKNLELLHKQYRQLKNIYIATPMQEGMLYHEMLKDSDEPYTNQTYTSITGDLNVVAFKSAWQAIVERYDIFRTSFNVTLGEQSHQLVMNTAKLQIYEKDWSNLSSDEQNTSLLNYHQEDLKRGFNLTKAPLMRLSLIKLSEYSYHFIWTHHHLLTDGWCLPILFKEIAHFYQAFDKKDKELLPPPIPYEQYIAWLYKQDKLKARNYWSENLNDVQAPTPLIVDKLPNNNRQGCDIVRLELPEIVSTRLGGLAKSQNITINVVVQAAWSYLLKCYSGENDVIFGATVSGRPAEVEGIEKMVGLFIASLPVRVSFKENMTLGELLFQLQVENVQREEYSYLGLPEIQALTQIPQGMPLFESLLVFENYPIKDVIDSLNGNEELPFSIGELKDRERGNFPITITAQFRKTLDIAFTFRMELFSQTVIQNVVKHFKNILLNMIELGSSIKLDQLSIAERNEALNYINELDFSVSSHQPNNDMCELFELQALKNPRSAALHFHSTEMTYSELNNKANQFARYLIENGLKNGDVIALYFERSFELVIGMLGVLKAGCIFSVVDSKLPQNRIDSIIEDCKPVVLVSQNRLLKSCHFDVDVIILDNLKLDIYSTGNIDRRKRFHEIAYIVYTSGSTGTPKGILIRHTSVANYLCFIIKSFKLDKEDRCLQLANLSFDASIREIFGTLCSGARLYLLSDYQVRHVSDILDTIVEKNITRILSIVPSLLRELVHDNCGTTIKDLTLKTILVSGEVLISSDYNSVRRTFGCNVELVNLYGPSECTMTSTYFRVNGNMQYGKIPIGKAIPNVFLLVLDKNRNILPVGLCGELHIGGIGVARGYLNRPELTK
ncbi:non-ribosomal peptide synthetase, partial [Microbulbifer epialgicus]